MLDMAQVGLYKTHTCAFNQLYDMQGVCHTVLCIFLQRMELHFGSLRTVGARAGERRDITEHIEVTVHADLTKCAPQLSLTKA